MAIDKKLTQKIAGNADPTKQAGRASKSLQSTMGNNGTKQVIEQGLVQQPDKVIAQQVEKEAEQSSILNLAETEVNAPDTVNVSDPMMVEAGIDTTMLATLLQNGPQRPRDSLHASIGMGIAVTEVLGRIIGPAALRDGRIPAGFAMVAIAARNNQPLGVSLEYLSDAMIESGNLEMIAMGEKMARFDGATAGVLKEFFYEAGYRAEMAVQQANRDGRDPLVAAIGGMAMDAERLPTLIEQGMAEDAASEAEAEESGPMLSQAAVPIE